MIKKCKYCDGQNDPPTKNLFGNKESLVVITGTVLYLDVNDVLDVTIGINYCPMCGRKLK